MMGKAFPSPANKDFRADASMINKSNTFLFEIIIVILFFSLCVAITLQLFSNSYLKSQLNKNTSIAILKTQTQAEIFKSIKNPYEIKSKFESLEKTETGFLCKILFDKNWEKTNESPRFIITMKITGSEKEKSIISADISAIEQNGDIKNELIEFTVKNFVSN